MEMIPIPLPRDIAYALDAAIGDEFSDVVILTTTAQRAWYSAPYMALNNADAQDIMKALVLGFVIEQSPEERIKDLYNNLKQADNSMTVAQAYRAGMKDALYALDIKYDWLNKGDKTKK